MKSGDQITIRFVLVDVALDAIMHAANMFEPFKRLILEPMEVVGKLQDGWTLEQSIQSTKTTLENNKRYRVIAIYHPHIAEGAWCDQEVVMVSSGFKCTKFADLLIMHDYAGTPPKRFVSANSAVLAQSK